MALNKLSSRFFESTRGKIVLAMRSEGKTVNQLSEAMGLTDNAVRAHLITLERDGLVRSGGTVKGFRKPHFVYELTDDARHVFPKFYDSLFNRLLESLKRRMPVEGLLSILGEIGRNMGSERGGSNGMREDRIQNALNALAELGGEAKAVTENGRLMIKSSGCPFADAVSKHPEVCRIAESLLAEVIGEPVNEVCDRSSIPRCRFAVGAAG
jgi:predicted ArsR family transcriptional regulator